MKSTLKIDFQSSGVPVIKIVQPACVLNPEPYDDVDPKDTLLKTFLHCPTSVERHGLFTLDTYFPVPFDGEPTHHITTIRPILHTDLFYRLRSILLSKDIVLHGSDYKQRVNDLFDAIDRSLDEEYTAIVNSDDSKEEITYSVHDNSDGFRDWLDSKGIEWRSNGHLTVMILTPFMDVFKLGREFQDHYRIHNPK